MKRTNCNNKVILKQDKRMHIKQDKRMHIKLNQTSRSLKNGEQINKLHLLARP